MRAPLDAAREGAPDEMSELLPAEVVGAEKADAEKAMNSYLSIHIHPSMWRRPAFINHGGPPDNWFYWTLYLGPLTVSRKAHDLPLHSPGHLWKDPRLGPPTWWLR